MSSYGVFVRDSDRNVVAELDDFDKLEIVLRFNLPGSWSLSGINKSADAATYLRPTEHDAPGIVIDRDGSTILSGPLAHYARERTTTDGFVEDLLDVSGGDDLVWLWRRIAHPSPTDGNFATQGEDVRTGAAETVMRGYVNANAGPGALGPRRVPGLTVAADDLRGDTLTERARLDVLGDLVASVALKGGGLGFRIVQTDTDLLWSVYQPSDRSDEIVLSDDVGNLADFSYSITAPEWDQVYVGGGGEDTARVFVERLDAVTASRWGRIESFRDRRDTTDLTELANTGDEELASNGEKVSFSVGAVDLPNMSFGVDYGLGDQVTAVVDDIEVVQVVREVHITVTSDGETVVPVLGSPGVAGSTDVITDLFDRLRRLSGRTTNLERR